MAASTIGLTDPNQLPPRLHPRRNATPTMHPISRELLSCPMTSFTISARLRKHPFQTTSCLQSFTRSVCIFKSQPNENEQDCNTTHRQCDRRTPHAPDILKVGEINDVECTASAAKDGRVAVAIAEDTVELEEAGEEDEDTVEDGKGVTHGAEENGKGFEGGQYREGRSGFIWVIMTRYGGWRPGGSIYVAEEDREHHDEPDEG